MSFIQSLKNIFRPLRVIIETDADRVARRCAEIRSHYSGFQDGLTAAREGGIASMFGGTNGITSDDYFIVGCDNACTARNFPGIKHAYLWTWFTGRNLPRDAGSFMNSHGTQKGGIWYIDAYHSNIPKPEFQCDPREVAWHYCRVKEMRKAGIDQAERRRILAAEATNKPWLVEDTAATN